MYERSAVILERFFSEKFYYKDKHNLKKNYENYSILIEILEKYQEVSETEDKIIKEREDIANNIKQIQKNQNSLYRKILKLHEDRNNIFEKIDESANDLGKQLDKIEAEIDKCNEKIRPIDQQFVDTLGMFNEKSDIRFECGKKRRKIEKEYRAILEKTVNNLSEIDTEKIQNIKEIIASDGTSIDELKEAMVKNGEKEKIPFDINVIEEAITLGQEIHNQEAQLLIELYEKTNSLIDEVSESVVKIKKYKKIAKDTKNRLDFIKVQKEYLFEFLDNERLSVGLGVKEHKKLMKEACIDFRNDVEQIHNLDELLISEINSKATTTQYNNLYSVKYLVELQKEEMDFENKLKKLNLAGTILNPIHWRIGSIEKIYTTFNRIVENEYGRNLAKFKIDIPDYNDEEDEDNEFDNANSIEITTPNTPSENNNKQQKTMEYDRFMEYYDNFTSDDPEKDNKDKENDDNTDDDDELADISIYQDIYQEDSNDDDEDDYYDDENYDESYDESDDEDSFDDDINDDIEAIIQKGKKRNIKSKKGKTGRKKGLFGFGGK